MNEWMEMQTQHIFYTNTIEDAHTLSNFMIDKYQPEEWCEKYRWDNETKKWVVCVEYPTPHS